MTHQQILEAAIEKAIANGWNKIDGMTFTRGWVPDNRTLYGRFNTIESGNESIGGSHYELNTVIYNHDFARALWGDEPYAKVTWPHPYYDGRGIVALVITPYWQYHLQQMVIAPDPIAYLGENL